MAIIRVTDASDARLEDYVGLTDVVLRMRHEPEKGLYIAESASVIERALEAGHVPRSFLMAERWLDPMHDLLVRAGATGDGAVPVFVAESDVLNGIAGFNVHRGALAAMQRPVLPSVASVLEHLPLGPVRVVVLEDIVDHTNVGAMFRSAAALGADAILVSPRCADPLYRRSVRVSMGAVFKVPWTRIDDWAGAMASLRQSGFVIAALALEPDALTLDELVRAAPDRIALVMGSEGDGLSRAAIEGADLSVRIPMHAGVDSLNVAAASAVALWALRAQPTL